MSSTSSNYPQVPSILEDLQMCIQQEVDQYDAMQAKFQKACNQVILLNNWIQDAQIRYDRALHENCRSFRYTLRLQLMSLEGARNMFYEYASRKAEELDSMQDRLRAQGISSIEDEGMEDQEEEYDDL